MTVHPSIARDHDLPGMQRYGANIGADIPIPASFTEPLRPLLNEYGNNPGFHFVAFTVDDTRALCSIPARHDMSRRTIAAFLGDLVDVGRLTGDDAAQAARDLVQTNPRKVFKL
jgi:glucuronate isomerase